jgi:glycosyltransferase involved in cell wall biosynthesis
VDMINPGSGSDECRSASHERGLRVLHVTEAPLGGVPVYLREVIAAQARSPQVESVHVLVPGGIAAALGTGYPAKVNIHLFRYKRGRVMDLAVLGKRARRLVRTLRPDIVHIHSTVAGGVVRASLLALRRRPKIVYCPHGWYFNARAASSVLRSAASRIERLLSHATDSILCISEFEKREAVAIGIPEAKCTVVMNGISEMTTEGAQPVTEEACRGGRLNILFVGRFDDQKGFPVYLAAMHRLRDIADGTAVGGFVVNRMKEEEIPDNVTVLGWRSRQELYDVYRQADVLIMPSLSEGFGLVAVEAMGAGVPVFASRVGGLPEIVLDHVTGRLFEVGNVDEIEHLVRVTDRPNLAAYGARGRERMKRRFTAARMNAELLAHYHQLIEEGRPLRYGDDSHGHRK